MAVNVFGLTAATIRAHKFPNSDDFSASSSPTAATVLEVLDEKAAELEGLLLVKSVSAATLTVATSAAYLWCRETLRLAVAIEAVQLMSGQDPAVAKAWQAKLDARLKRLDALGPAALGDNALNIDASLPNGPTSHVSDLALDTGDDADASDVIPALRRSDLL